MGRKIICKCGHDRFVIFANVYSKNVLKFPHIEIVCQKCGLGRPYYIIPLNDKVKEML